MIELPFTHRPGRRERHLRRQHGNPLFAWPPREVAPEALLAAQGADHAAMEAFAATLGVLVERAAALPPDAGSDLVLDLKAELEKQYEESCGLPEDHTKARGAIRRLIDLIMAAVERAAVADPLARQELAEERAARELHFQLLEQPLIADLLHPESPIGPEELAPTVLSASEAEILALGELLDPHQLDQLIADAEQCIARLEAAGVALAVPRQRLTLLRGLRNADC